MHTKKDNDGISTCFQLEAEDLLTALIMGESEAEPILGKIAVAQVVRNRVNDDRWPDDWKEVMLQRYQFSCFLPQYFRPETLKHGWGSIYWKESKYAAFGVYNGYVRDPVDGANHYLASWLGRDPDWAYGKKPKWAESQKPVAEIGQHVFYRL